MPCNALSCLVSPHVMWSKKSLAPIVSCRVCIYIIICKLSTIGYKIISQIQIQIQTTKTNTRAKPAQPMEYKIIFACKSKTEWNISSHLRRRRCSTPSSHVADLTILVYHRPVGMLSHRFIEHAYFVNQKQNIYRISHVNVCLYITCALEMGGI